MAGHQFVKESGSNQTASIDGLLVEALPSVPAEYSFDLYRIYFVERGETTVQLENWTMDVVPGTILAASPAEAISFRRPVSTRSVAFHHDFFCVRVKRTEVFCDGVVFNRLAGEPRIILPELEWSLIRHRFEELGSVASSGGVLARERAISALRSILLQSAEFKLLQLADDEATELVPAPMSDLVLRFQDLLESHYVSHRDLAFYCAELHVTPATLNRHLRAEMGQTALQAINERLAIAARVELRSGRKSVKQVAFDLGFDDPLYFSRFFKKQFGLSPSHYFTEPPVA